MEADRGRSLGTQRQRRAWILVNAGYASILVILALAPSSLAPGLQIPDSVAHATAYGLQALLLYFLFLFVGSSRPWTSVVAAALCAVGFGLFTEALQLLQPARSVEFRDIMANSVGVAIAGAGITGINRVIGRGSGD
jgi:VanZ family protein